MIQLFPPLLPPAARASIVIGSAGRAVLNHWKKQEARQGFEQGRRYQPPRAFRVRLAGYSQSPRDGWCLGCPASCGGETPQGSPVGFAAQPRGLCVRTSYCAVQACPYLTCNNGRVLRSSQVLLTEFSPVDSLPPRGFIDIADSSSSCIKIFTSFWISLTAFVLPLSQLGTATASQRARHGCRCDAGSSFPSPP